MPETPQAVPETPPAMADVPLVATYRLQLTPSFGLDRAAEIVPYLARLGISHVYTSSYLQAAPGSTHGYDVVDPSSVNAELGGEQGLEQFHRAVADERLGHVIDVVPNHMAVGVRENQLWWDVLKFGRASAAAHMFDIDWEPPESKLSGKILLPVLGGSYGHEIASGSIVVAAADDGAEVHYADHRFPIDPASLSSEQTTDLSMFGDPALLHGLLERQHYRLASWTVGRHELNYRRFFEVNTLAGVRVEDPMVFDAVHQRSLGWVADGTVQGLRIDHPDGLRDPGGYLARLRTAAPESWIVIEKILEPGESLPDEWPVDGTTGYDLMQLFTSVFVAPESERSMTDAYADLTGEVRTYPDVLAECKTGAVRDLLGTEVTRLTSIASRICERSVVARDVSRRNLQAALEAILVASPVYRTYVVDGRSTAIDRDVIAHAIATAKTLQPDLEPGVFDFIGSVWAGGDATSDHPDELEFVARLQQLSGPAMAKGAEDTAFYRYHRLIALNEVGSDPAQFGVTVDAFHAAMAQAARDRPLSMSATSTHDTKRSEDVRVRIALLSEMVDEWRAAASEWRGSNRVHWDTNLADLNMEYQLYQTLVGAHPLSADRLVEFATKAMREAKQHTSWIRQDASYEEAVTSFIRNLDADADFRRRLDDFVDRLVVPGRMASLSQALMKSTVPGIPDFYQGSELWTTSLVDPDNRTEIDYAVRRRVIDAADGAADVGATPLADDRNGATKMGVIRTALALRRLVPDAFTGPAATYAPIDLRGNLAGAGLAFARGERVITVAVVRPVAVARSGWGDTSIDLPPGDWYDAIAHGPAPIDRDGAHPTLSGTVRLADFMIERSVALLVRKETQ